MRVGLRARLLDRTRGIAQVTQDVIVGQQMEYRMPHDQPHLDHAQSEHQATLVWQRYRDGRATPPAAWNDVIEQLFQHRSVRSYLRDPLPAGTLEVHLAEERIDCGSRKNRRITHRCPSCNRRDAGDSHSLRNRAS